MLRLEDVSASYRGLRALQGVSLDVARGEIVAVVGANGAGKSTLLKSIAGQVATEGTIEFEGQSLRRLPAHRITRLGVSMVPEGRRLFPRLSVEDNLRLGAYAKRGARSIQAAGTGVLAVPAPAGAALRSAPKRCRAASSRCWRSVAR